jgi:hypothetical protein
MVKREKEGELTVGHRRRGRGALESDSEVVPAVLDGDGVHDGLQEITASPKVWSMILRASCNGGEGRLELGVLAGVLWA